MANRNDSDVRQHETLPGPGPGPNSALPDGARPVEQMVDAAIERIAREHARSAGNNEPAYPLALPMKPTRLRWKGLDVSEEFKAYAERVGRGEDLPPFEGRVLAEPNPAFPWGPSSTAALPPKKGSGPRVALWGSAIVVLGLLAWSVGMKLEADARDEAASSAALERAFTATPSDPTSAALSAPVPGGSIGNEPLPHDPLPHDVVETQVTARTAGDPASELGTAETSSGAPAAVGDAEEARNLAALDTAPADTVAAGLPGSATTEPSSGQTLLGGSSGAALAGGSRGGAAAAPTPAARAPLASSPAVAAPAGANGSAPKGTAVSALPAPVAEPARAPASKPIEEDFGIDPASGPGAPAAKTAPAVGASIGDLAKAGQGSGGNVRKEPGSESSAKGSLLVETPSF
jgi:hypothetical protein